MKRRRFIQLATAASFMRLMPALATANKTKIQKVIPASGELIPAIGMGTWITFNVGNSPTLRAARTKVLSTFVGLGGGMIDSSPMYGSAQAVVGEALATLNYPQTIFSADKIWTRSTNDGPKQFAQMQKLWGVEAFDLIQIHNLVNWQAHLETLQQLKADGYIKYIGITTSHGLRHSLFEQILESEPLDFIQLTYNITHREVEQRLLPLAKEKGVAVIANRPLDGGQLMDQFASKPLPPWAREYDIDNWAQFFLKFIIAHPAITCAIPATSQVEHMQENMGACYGRLPDTVVRQTMIDYLATL